ncbi:MAG: N-acetylglucosamine-6-phosphate deacetylase [Verrucomicrobia bacterium]|nr:N-acetylglucosamine-6-phosphate deacetylase [Verrucomicrobiota bacterium]
MQFTNARLILPDEMFRGSLTVRNGRIAKISREAKPKQRGADTLDLKGGFLAPGFIDLHIHGGMGADTMEANEKSFRTITEFHLRGGTTSITLTTVTAAEGDILKVLAAAKPFHNRSLGNGARIVGVHIEGPFLALGKAGAQNPAFIRNPVAREWKKFLRFGKLVTEMTLAPENPGSLELIRALRKNGTIASGGHTDATEAHLVPALKAGLNQATHTFNAMSTITKTGPYRHAGMIEFTMAQDEIMAELIADSVHVPPILMRMLINAKGRDGVVIITDATCGAGLPPGTKFSLLGIQARTTENVAVMDDGTGLAGSTLTMIQGVQRVHQLAGAPLVDAVRMATLNPAKQLGREKEFGSLATGKRADLVWFDEKFRVRGVWVDGEGKFKG